jgi:hypothetical protein
MVPLFNLAQRPVATMIELPESETQTLIGSRRTRDNPLGSCRPERLRRYAFFGAAQSKLS